MIETTLFGRPDQGDRIVLQIAAVHESANDAVDGSSTGT